MKQLILTILLLLIWTLGFGNAWKYYEGKLSTNNISEKIELKLLFLNDGIMIGSYRKAKNPEQYKLIGNIKKDSLFLTIRLSATDEYNGMLIGKLNKKHKRFVGILQDTIGQKVGKVRLKRVFKNSYTDILNKHRSLYEYESFDEALVQPRKVKSIDMASQGLEQIPDIFDKFKNLVSINLLGNKIDIFPVELAKAKRLKELSLSSNGLKVVKKEIGDLSELRILIMNFNKIKVVPKEIGNLTKLLYLDLGDNQISYFPDEIGNLQNLQEFHVDDNLLTDAEKERLQKLLPNCVIHYGH